MNEFNENSIQNTNEPDENSVNQNEEAPKKGKKEKEKLTGWPRVLKELREWAVSLVVAVAAVYVISNFLFLPIKVDGDSMNPTLASGERLFVTVFDVKVMDKLEKGDIVICNYYGRTNKDPLLHLIDMKTNFVKRIVGVPGDTVSKVSGVTYINGEPLDPQNEHTGYSYTLKETYEKEIAEGGTETVYVIVRKDTRTGQTKELEYSLKQAQNIDLDYEYVLGEEEYFVVGDNRYNSHDSRDWNGPEIERYAANNTRGDVGPITKDMIVGRAKCVFWPLGEFRKTENDPYYAYPGDPAPTGSLTDNGGSNEDN